MLDQLDLKRKISKQEYKERLATLQERLYHTARALFEARIPAIIVIEGWAGTAKVRTISAITSRLDPRGLRVHPITPPRTYETQYPWLYRFWLKIPSYGQIAIFDRSWYRQILGERTHGELRAEEWSQRCQDITVFERQLADDGTVIIKCWLHISKEEQGRRFRNLLADRLTAWQITDEDRWQHQHYELVRTSVEDLLTRTSRPYAPWITIPATNKRYARIAALEAILATLERRLGIHPPDEPAYVGLFDGQHPAVLHEPLHGEATNVGRLNGATAGAAGSENGTLSPRPAPPITQAPPILQRVDLTRKLDKQRYERELALLQTKLHLLGFQVYRQNRPVVLIFEGWDAAGKGGAIKRITEKLDPRSYIVHAISAPAGEDNTRHFLYRFWRRLPPRGMIAIFDRSWYGRVLVERVEGFARDDEWQRAYAEINEFEQQLIEFGTIMCKFWLHLSPDEQLRRFENRKNSPHKTWKLTDEDWRNREKWPQYEQAAEEMLLHTSPEIAPWTVVESEDKRFARIKVLATIVRRLEDELGKIKL